MKTLKQDELYESLSRLLKKRGIELSDGSFAHGIRQGCGILTDAINAGQRTFDRAKTRMDVELEKMRRTIHEKTSPRQPAGSKPDASEAAPPAPSAKTQARPKRKPAVRKTATAAGSTTARKPATRRKEATARKSGSSKV